MKSGLRVAVCVCLALTISHLWMQFHVSKDLYLYIVHSVTLFIVNRVGWLDGR